MVEWSVASLRTVAQVDRIVVALPAGDLDAVPVGAIAVAGGVARSDSVLNALAASGDGDPVIVHDAARPLAEAELFERALDELERSGVDAVIAATPVADTIKELEDDRRTVLRTLDRTRLWAVQTPQVFRRQALERALRGAANGLRASATDDAWLVEQAGGTVQVVDGGPRNIKVTTATDLRLAELLLEERGRELPS
jgi:2-C-methyl-D-erythritol 4-phosphate cytidylyltransferase